MSTVLTTPSLQKHDVLVMVGDGAKAHVLRTNPMANAKTMALRDGMTVYDICLCGGRGALTAATDDADLCGTCAGILEG